MTQRTAQVDLTTPAGVRVEELKGQLQSLAGFLELSGDDLNTLAERVALNDVDLAAALRLQAAMVCTLARLARNEAGR